MLRRSFTSRLYFLAYLVIGYLMNSPPITSLAADYLLWSQGCLLPTPIIDQHQKPAPMNANMNKSTALLINMAYF